MGDILNSRFLFAIFLLQSNIIVPTAPLTSVCVCCTVEDVRDSSTSVLLITFLLAFLYLLVLSR